MSEISIYQKETAPLFGNCKKATLGETTRHCGKEKVSLDLEEGNLEERRNRTVGRSSLLEESKLPKKGRKGYNKCGRTQQLQSRIKKEQNKSVYVKGEC